MAELDEPLYTDEQIEELLSEITEERLKIRPAVVGKKRGSGLIAAPCAIFNCLAVLVFSLWWFSLYSFCREKRCRPVPLVAQWV